MIKLFDEYNSYYQEISSIPDHDRVEFTYDGHIKYLKKNCTVDFSHSLGYTEIWINDDNILLRVTQSVDEWFYVKVQTKDKIAYYRCDQLKTKAFILIF